jgi:hypothetical protein
MGHGTRSALLITSIIRTLLSELYPQGRNRRPLPEAS